MFSPVEELQFRVPLIFNLDRIECSMGATYAMSLHLNLFLLVVVTCSYTPSRVIR